jgi:hypothetical protein
MSRQESNTATWIQLNNHPDYEIMQEAPHYIRKRSNGYIVKETLTGGYLKIMMRNKPYMKHRIIAEQFIPNPRPERFRFIQHKDGDNTNNNIDNLYWSSKKYITNNRHDQDHTDTLPDGAIAITNYNDSELEDVYYHNGIFYVFNGLGYNIKRIQTDGRNLMEFVQVTDREGKRVCIWMDVFRLEHRNL